MVASLAMLPRLKKLYIKFKLVTPQPYRKHPSITRAVLPALTIFGFQGTSEYLEDLVAPIDGPQLNRIILSIFELRNSPSSLIVQSASR